MIEFHIMLPDFNNKYGEVVTYICCFVSFINSFLLSKAYFLKNGGEINVNTGPTSVIIDIMSDVLSSFLTLKDFTINELNNINMCNEWLNGDIIIPYQRIYSDLKLFFDMFNKKLIQFGIIEVKYDIENLKKLAYNNIEIFNDYTKLYTNVSSYFAIPT